MFTSGKPVALITGASSGIGYELAKQFAENGFDIIVTAENAELSQAAERLRATGARVESIQADLRQRDEIHKLYNYVKDNNIKLDAAALNAGVGVGGAFVEEDLQAQLDIIDLNVTSTVHLAKHILEDMVKRNSGRILFTGSVVPNIPSPYQAVYSASKAFVLNFAEAIREELKDTDITITTLMPGATETNFFERAGLEDTKVGQSKKDDPADVAKDGFDALMKGENKVVAHSILSKTQGVMGNLMPGAMNAKMIGGMSKPGSGK